MAELQQFIDLCNKFQGIVDFAIIYVEEAHPADGWIVKHQRLLPAQNNISDRIDAASELQSMCPNIPMYVDPFDNKICKAFAAYPERLYVVQDNVVRYQGKMGPFGYSLDEVETWLVKNT